MALLAFLLPRVVLFLLLVLPVLRWLLCVLPCHWLPLWALLTLR